MPFNKAFINISRLIFQQTALDFDTRGQQRIKPQACHLWIGVFTGNHHTHHTSCNQRVSTWTGFTLMTAGLQRYIDRCPRNITGTLQCLDLSVIPPSWTGKTLTNNFVVNSDNTADGRIGP